MWPCFFRSERTPAFPAFMTFHNNQHSPVSYARFSRIRTRTQFDFYLSSENRQVEPGGTKLQNRLSRHKSHGHPLLSQPYKLRELHLIFTPQNAPLLPLSPFPPVPRSPQEGAPHRRRPETRRRPDPGTAEAGARQLGAVRGDAEEEEEGAERYFLLLLPRPSPL